MISVLSILDLNDELVELDAQRDDLTAEAAPTLRAINAVGAQVAAMERLAPS